ATGVDLPLRLLFEAPTVAGLTARLRDALAPGASDSWAAIPRRSPDAALPLSFAQERLWFLDQLTPGTAVHNVPGVLAISGRLDGPALAAALSEIVRRHEALRTVFRAPAGEPAQWVLPPSTPPLPLIDLSALPEAARDATADRLRHAEVARGFDLEHGPLFRASILRLGPERHLLLLTFHHIAFDGWSVGIFTRELSALYGAALARRRCPSCRCSTPTSQFGSAPVSPAPPWSASPATGASASPACRRFACRST